MKDPCWKGYEMIGVKEKAGRTVPNCVPINRDPMPYHLELGSGGHSFGKDKAIVVNSKTGHHFSKAPISLISAERQLRLLRGVEHGMKPRRG